MALATILVVCQFCVTKITVSWGSKLRPWYDWIVCHKYRILLYEIECFINVSAINKIDNLTCVIPDNLTCVDYHETRIRVYCSIFGGGGAIRLIFIRKTEQHMDPWKYEIYFVCWTACSHSFALLTCENGLFCQNVIFYFFKNKEKIKSIYGIALYNYCSCQVCLNFS